MLIRFQNFVKRIRYGDCYRNHCWKTLLHRPVRFRQYDLCIKAHLSSAYLISRVEFSEVIFQSLYTVSKSVNYWISLKLTTRTVTHFNPLVKVTWTRLTTIIFIEHFRDLILTYHATTENIGNSRSYHELCPNCVHFWALRELHAIKFRTGTHLKQKLFFYKFSKSYIVKLRLLYSTAAMECLFYFRFCRCSYILNLS